VKKKVVGQRKEKITNGKVKGQKEKRKKGRATGGIITRVKLEIKEK
jgi:hypothetical protein